MTEDEKEAISWAELEAIRTDSPFPSTSMGGHETRFFRAGCERGFLAGVEHERKRIMTPAIPLAEPVEIRISEKEESLEEQIEEALNKSGPIFDTAKTTTLIKALIHKREEMAWAAAREFFDNPTQSGIIINLSIDERWRYLTITDYRREQEGK